MIQQEILDDGFVRTWSDNENCLIRNKVTGDTFLDAIDNPEWGCEYEEIEKPNDGKEVNDEIS